MSIAVVVNDEGIVTKIVDGTVLRIIEKNQMVTDFRNPALDLTEGRRGATLRKAIEEGATVFIAPPETFCEQSYKKAQEEHVTFYNIAPNLAFAEVVQALKGGSIEMSTDLPAEQVLPSAPVKQ